MQSESEQKTKAERNHRCGHCLPHSQRGTEDAVADAHVFRISPGGHNAGGSDVTVRSPRKLRLLSAAAGAAVPGEARAGPATRSHRAAARGWDDSYRVRCSAAPSPAQRRLALDTAVRPGGATPADGRLRG